MTKRDELDKLYLLYKQEFYENEVVLGDGDVDSKLLLIGEAPGKDEVRLGRPFVGMAGKNLNEFIEALGIERSALYITNAIKYRLSKINTETGRMINRPASLEEIKQNRDYLLKEISIIQPAFIVTLGNVPLRSVTGEFDSSIGQLHGNKKVINILDREYCLFPLYHPASIIYNKNLKETYKEDLIKLKDILDKK